MQTGKILLEKKIKEIACFRLNEDIFAYLSDDNSTFCIYDFKASESTIYNDLSNLQQIKCVGENQFFIASYEKLYDCFLKEGNVLKVSKSHKFFKSVIEDIDASSDGSLVSMAAYDKVFIVKDSVLNARKFDSAGWKSTCISNDNKYIVYGSNEKIIVIKTETLEVFREYDIESPMYSLQISSTNESLLLCDESKNIVSMDIVTGGMTFFNNPKFQIPIKIISISEEEFLVFFESNFYYKFKNGKKEPEVIEFDGIKDIKINDVQKYSKKSVLISFWDSKEVLIVNV